MSSSSSPLTPDLILQTAFAFWSSKILLPAVEFEVFIRLGSGTVRWPTGARPA